MRYVLSIFSISLFLFLFACTSDQSSEVTAIPQLLDRPEAIQHGKEWEKVQNVYAAAKLNLEQADSDLENYLKLAEVFILEARVTGEHGHYYPGALKVLNALLEKVPEAGDLRFRALSMKASVLLSQHEFEQALAVGKEAAQMNPYNAQIYGVLTDALVEMGRYQEAVAMADKMVSIRPDLRSYSRVSYLREIHGDVEGAIQAMKMAVDAGFPGLEQTAWTRLTLGDIYQNYGQLDEAERQYQLILTERKNYPFAIGALADVQMRRGDLAEAEKLIHEAKAIIPEVGFYIQLADLYKQTDRMDQYAQTLEEVMVMLKDDVDHGHNMNLEYADVHLNLTEDYAQALAFAQKEYEKRPANIDVNRMLAVIHYKMDAPEQARKHMQAASSTASAHPELQMLQGLLAIEAGDEERGKEQIQKLLIDNPSQSHALVEQAKAVKI